MTDTNQDRFWTCYIILIFAAAPIGIQVAFPPLFGHDHAVWSSEALKGTLFKPWWASEAWISRRSVAATLAFSFAAPFGFGLGVLLELLSGAYQHVGKRSPRRIAIAFAIVWLAPVFCFQLLIGGFFYWVFIYFMLGCLMMGWLISSAISIDKDTMQRFEER